MRKKKRLRKKWRTLKYLHVKAAKLGLRNFFSLKHQQLRNAIREHVS